jgi:arylsulfatase A-like enzyme
MNEMIDEACGRVLARIAQRGWDDDTDVFFTTDHGELQGDYGLIFKGPFHTDSLMRLPMVWRPAPSAGVAGGVEISEPVGQLDLAPTFCDIAGVPRPDWVEGAPLPTAPGNDRERVVCEWDSQFPGYGMHLRTDLQQRLVVHGVRTSTIGQPNGLEEWFAETGMFGGVGPKSTVAYNGTEGELYDVEDDPHQWENRWDDPRAKRCAKTSSPTSTTHSPKNARY